MESHHLQEAQTQQAQNISGFKAQTLQALRKAKHDKFNHISGQKLIYIYLAKGRMWGTFLPLLVNLEGCQNVVANTEGGRVGGRKRWLNKPNSSVWWLRASEKLLNPM